ncbi:MAG: methyltransferase domain-containing protein [Deltaproteobacteria bacterium]|jgi:SAM-dependent methyltransferase|nr:methyltransferase domain-containing protein [Deltaproteobacteria bacterium]
MTEETKSREKSRAAADETGKNETKENPSRDYRDYFIKDGKHAGDYEGMYRNTPDPWDIEALGLRLDMSAAILLARTRALATPGPARVLDAGAGAGLFSLALFEALREKNPDLVWCLNDISPTALNLAKARFEKAGHVPEALAFDIRGLPRVLAEGKEKVEKERRGRRDRRGPSERRTSPDRRGRPERRTTQERRAAPDRRKGVFPHEGEDKRKGERRLAPARRTVAERRTDSPRRLFPERREGKDRRDARSDARAFLAPASYDLVVLAQVLWGIMDNLFETLSAMKKLLKPGGALLVSQHFPGADVQEYGREVTKPEDLSAILESTGLSRVATLETDRETNHHWGSLWTAL